MSKIRMLLLLSAAAIVGACSDTQTPSAPSDDNQLTLQLDPSSAAVTADDEVSTEQAAGAGQFGTGGKGKQTGPRAEVVSCVHNAWHELCTDIRNGRLRAADGDAIVEKSFVNSTRGELRINGVLWAWTNTFGPVFFGDDIFSRFRGLNIRVFRGDKICSKFKNNPAPQVCGIVR